MSNSAQLDTTMIRAIDRIYARALLELAQEQNVLDDVADQMNDLATLVKENPQFGQLLRSPSIESTVKQKMLEHVFKASAHPLVYQFMLVLERKNRIGSFPSIVLAFRELYNDKHGVMEIKAEVAQPLDDTTKQAVADWISKVVNRQVAIHATVNEDLIGGIKFRAGDHQFDGSIATQLRRLRRNLSAAGETTARNLVNQIVVEG